MFLEVQSKVKSSLKPSGSFKPVLISPVFIVLSGWESFTPLGQDTNPSQISSQWTKPRRKKSLVRSGRKGHTNIHISAKPGIELGTLWLESRDLTNCTNHTHHLESQGVIKSMYCTSTKEGKEISPSIT